jgi:hypothetical protein
MALAAYQQSVAAMKQAKVRSSGALRLTQEALVADVTDLYGQPAPRTVAGKANGLSGKASGQSLAVVRQSATN